MKNRRPVVIRRMSTTLFWWFLTTLMVAGPGLAQWWGPKTFDGVIGTLVQELIGQVDLKTQPVVVQSYGFFDSDTGLSLPLSGVLKDRVITALLRQGVRVFLQEADPSASWWLHGTWRKLGNEVLLDFRLVVVREQGPEAVASASGQVPLSTLDANWLVPDRGSWGRYLLRKLEESASFLTPKSLYVAGVRVQNRDYASSELETYLSEWLAGACVESARFKVVDPKQALMALPAAQIRTRGLRLPAGASDPATQDFTAALVQAEGELKGTAWISPQVIEIRANVYGPNGGQLAYASADVPRQLFPPSIFRPAAGPSDDSEASSDALVTRHGLKLDLTTNAGQRPEFIEGEKVRFVLRVNRDAYVYLFNINLKGEAVVLYPVDEQGDLAQKPPCGSVHPGGVPIVLPEDGCSYDIVVSEPFGKDRIWACASEVPLAIDPKLRGQWARGNGLIRNTRKASAVTGGGYAEAFVDVMTRSADKR